LWSALVGVVVFVGLWLYFRNYKNTAAITTTQYLYYALCYIVGIQLTSFFTALFYANRNFFLPNFLMVLLNALVILIIPKQQGTENTDTALIIKLYFAFFLLTGVVLAFAFILKKQSWKTFSLPAFLNIRLLVKYALISLAANLIFFLVYRIDFWFVKKYCSANDLGNYIQVSKLGQMLLIVPSIISSVVFPQTASGTIERSKMKENIMRIGRITSVLFIIFFVFILATGNKLFPFVFGATFNRMFIPFILLLPGIWALSNLSILSAYFGGVNKVKVNVQGAALALLFIIIADYIFIPKFGMFAAALISTAGYALNFMYSFVILQREHEVSLSEYWRINKADIKWLKSITNK
jgi:O-antigen/teichoic acid export membrane protein